MKTFQKNIKMFVVIILLSNCTNFSAYGKNNSLMLKDKVYHQAILMNMYFMNGDYNKFLDFIHPGIIEISGGRDKMIALFKQGLGPGIEFISTKYQKPEKLIISDSSIQCSLKQRQEIKMFGKVYYTIGYLIGISYDSGKTWKFIGVAGNTLSSLKTYFPELSDHLDVKSQTPPIPVD